MSALRTHEEGDCWSPCYYCHIEDEMSDAITEEDVEEGTE